VLLVAGGLLALAPARAHGAFHDRLRELAAALEANPRDARLHFELARIFCQHEDWLFALAAADSADEFQPHAFPTDLLRGEIALGRGDPAKARAALNRHLAANPSSPRALVLRARARAALADAAGAIADYRAALRADARPEIDHVREAAAALARQGDRAEAADALARAIATFGPDPALLGQALEIEVAVGRFAAALARVDALQAAAPRPEPWLARRAQILAQAGNPGAARAAWIALQRHLEALPTLERGSSPMRALADQARAALATLVP
jgi:tetratricopeptide (TPR) repeat protein